jgi:hypothetical protein
MKRKERRLKQALFICSLLFYLNGQSLHWADLKARHAIQIQVPKARRNAVDETLALALFELYFGALPSTAPEWVEPVTLEHLQPSSAAVKRLTGRDDAAGIVDWLDGLVNVGWQLSN